MIELYDNFDLANRETVELVHSKEYLDLIYELDEELKGLNEAGKEPRVLPLTPRVQERLQDMQGDDLKKPEQCDTGFSAGTLQASLRSAGSVCAAVDAVMDQSNRVAFCIVRPPGHHAGVNGLLENGSSCGFCVINNIMIGALHALKHRADVSRVAIIDVDVHHGNGTEEIVRQFNYESFRTGSKKKIMFLSSHLFEKQDSYEFYPGTGESSDLLNNVVNIPIKPLWKKKGHSLSSGNENSHKSMAEKIYADTFGRVEFLQTFKLQMIPAMRSFEPDLILISAGFDASSGDVGNTRFYSQKINNGMDLKQEDFYYITSEIKKVANICCDGRVVSVLEGGYGSLCGRVDVPAVSEEKEKEPVGEAVTRVRPRGDRGMVVFDKIDREPLAMNVSAHVLALANRALPVNALGRKKKPILPPKKVYGPYPRKKVTPEPRPNEPVSDTTSSSGSSNDEEEEEGDDATNARRSKRKRKPRKIIDFTPNGQNSYGNTKLSKVVKRSSSVSYNREKKIRISDSSVPPVPPVPPLPPRVDPKEYLLLIKNRYETSQPAKYSSFLEIMKDFSRKAITIDMVIEKIKALFKDDSELIRKFATFLPETYRARLEEVG